MMAVVITMRPKIKSKMKKDEVKFSLRSKPLNREYIFTPSITRSIPFLRISAGYIAKMFDTVIKTAPKRSRNL